MKGLLSASEVCVKVNCSLYSLNNWYKFKRENPDHEFAQKLPDFINLEEGKFRKRYWKKSDIEKLIEFKNTLPHGRNGILGSVTQKYVKKQEDKIHGKKTSKNK